MKTTGPTRAQIRRVQEPYERLVRARPDDPEALCALAGQLVLWAAGRRGDLTRAERLARRALALSPDRAVFHALAGRIHEELDELASAVACARRAVERRPGELDYANNLLHLLALAGDQAEFECLLPTVARRHRIDLGKTRRELRQAKMPADAQTVYRNAFPHAYNYLTSRLWSEVEAFEKRHWSLLHRRGEQTALQHARASRRAHRVRARVVPADLRALASLARKWGIGDDADRGLLLSHITTAERRALRRALPVTVRRRINAWLEEFPDAGRMPPEAAAFMYLLEAYEELPSLTPCRGRRRPPGRTPGRRPS